MGTIHRFDIDQIQALLPVFSLHAVCPKCTTPAAADESLSALKDRLNTVYHDGHDDNATSHCRTKCYPFMRKLVAPDLPFDDHAHLTEIPEHFVRTCKVCTYAWLERLPDDV